MSDVEEVVSETSKKPNSVWKLLVWFTFLAVTTIIVKLVVEDPGWGNTVAYVSIGLAAIGFAVWTIRNSGWSSPQKWIVAFLPICLCTGFFSQVLPWEMMHNGGVGFVGWRWRGSEPDKQLALPAGETQASLDWQESPNDYPRFLGNGYWAEVPDVALDIDWQKNPPREVWRKKIGAGWSSFAIVGNYAVTQEQRGEQELVTCYEITTGEIVWTHADNVRWDPRGAGKLGYAGPRATPTIHEGRVFSQGATGILNCIDASSGELLWSIDTLKQHDANNIMWGKACSPLIVDDMVVVSVGGEEGQSLVAYTIEKGEVVWQAGTARSSYASPILAEFDGERQIVSVNEAVVTGHRVSDGEILWECPWDSQSDGSAATSQPIPIDGDRLFLSKGYGHGAALLRLSKQENGTWQTQMDWRETVMKTKMSNVVIRDGYVYGLDDVNLQCINLESGKKEWKKRRRPGFGYGQVMLLGDVILVTTEEGELILVETNPKKYRELASLRAFPDDQITWNNPAFSSPYLLVRNAQEVVCYELPLLESPTTVQK